MVEMLYIAAALVAVTVAVVMSPRRFMAWWALVGAIAASVGMLSAIGAAAWGWAAFCAVLAAATIYAFAHEARHITPPQRPRAL